VHQDQVQAPGLRGLEPLPAVRRDQDVESLPPEVPRQPVPALLVVLDQQHSGHGCPLIRPGRRRPSPPRPRPATVQTRPTPSAGRFRSTPAAGPGQPRSDPWRSGRPPGPTGTPPTAGTRPGTRSRPWLASVDRAGRATVWPPAGPRPPSRRPPRPPSTRP